MKCDSEKEEAPIRTLSLRELARIPAVRLVWLVFITACGIEFTVGVWCSTYLVQAKSMPVDTAARMAMLFYLGMAVGRFLSGVLAGRLTAWQLVRYSQMLVLCSIIFLLLPLGMYAAAAGLFVIGLAVFVLVSILYHVILLQRLKPSIHSMRQIGIKPKAIRRQLVVVLLTSVVAALCIGTMLSVGLFGYISNLLLSERMTANLVEVMLCAVVQLVFLLASSTPVCCPSFYRPILVALGNV